MDSDFKYSCFFKICLNYFKSNPRFQASLSLFNRGQVLAVLVTVQVQLLVPEFMVTHLQPYLLTIPLRDSESDYPFNPVGQFHRICAGHLGVRLAQL